MSDLKGPVGELRFTLTVKRKDTGKVETFDMVGHVLPEQDNEKEHEHGSDPQHGGA